MIVRRFLLWARTASTSERANAVRMLCDAYVQGLMGEDDRRDAETAMLSLLDDPSALVRRALAESIAGERAPRAVVLGLTQDQPDIAALVLAASPMLEDADLVDAVALGDELIQTAVARRQTLGIAVSAALVEVACAPAVAMLLDNPGAELAAMTLSRAATRLGDDAAVRAALLARPDLPLAQRHELATRLASALTGWAGRCGLMSGERAERVSREATEKVAVGLAARHEGFESELHDLVAQLRASHRLTPGLLLRSLVTGETALAEAALAQLAGLPLARVTNLLRDRRGAGVPALCRRAKIPDALVPAFQAAIEAVGEVGAVLGEASRAKLTRRIIERVLIACDASDLADHTQLMAMLRRFEAEAAREEAQELAQSLADDAALAALIAVDPELTLLGGTDDHQGGEPALPRAA